MGWVYRGLGKERKEVCGCRIIAYPGGKIVHTGCAEHPHHLRYVCPVCGRECKTDKALGDHRWEHGY